MPVTRSPQTLPSHPALPLPSLLAQLEESVHNLPAPQPEHLTRFTQLYAEQFGIRLEPTQALEQLTHLLVIARYKQLDTQFRQRREHGVSQASADP